VDTLKNHRARTVPLVAELVQADRLLAEGQEIPEVAKHLEVSEAATTHHRWRAQYGGLKVERRQTPQGTGDRERSAEADRGRQGASDRGVEGAGGETGEPGPLARAVEHLQRVFGVSPAVGVPASDRSPEHQIRRVCRGFLLPGYMPLGLRGYRSSLCVLTQSYAVLYGQIRPPAGLTAPGPVGCQLLPGLASGNTAHGFDNGPHRPEAARGTARAHSLDLFPADHGA
jgi:hypothetical protein